MRTPRSQLSALPAEIRHEINRKLLDGWRFTTLRDWLFDQQADRDLPHLHLKTGDPYSLLWTRSAKDLPTARETCRYRISQWHRTYHRDWLKEQAERDKFTALTDRVEQLITATDKSLPGANAGGNLIIRSLLLKAIVNLDKEKLDTLQLTRLATAWARLSMTSVRIQHSIDLGMETLREEIPKNPRALEAFNQLYAIVKGTEPPPDSQ
jgi:hypothetical protein